MRKPITVHPLGGCIMGNDQRTGVVNSWGEVFGYPNLYVADGSNHRPIGTRRPVHPMRSRIAAPVLLSKWLLSW